MFCDIFDYDPDVKTKKLSAYNIKLGEFMKKISLEEKAKPKNERMSSSDRMKRAQQMYREWKSGN